MKRKKKTRPASNSDTRGSTSVKELREQYGTLANKVYELRDKSNDPKHAWSAEDESNWTQVNKDLDDVGARLRRAERAEKVEREFSDAADRQPQRRQRPGADDYDGREERDKRERGEQLNDETRAAALQGWCRHQAGLDLSREQREACKRSRLNPSRKEIVIDLGPDHLRNDYAEAYRSLHPTKARRDLRRDLRKDIRSGLFTASGSAGGFWTAPARMVGNLELAMLAFGPMLRTSDVIRDDDGAPLIWPMGDDTSNEGTLVSELGDVTTAADPTSEKLTLYKHKYSSKMVKVSFEMLRDAAFNLAQLLADMLGERLGRGINRDATTGTGAGRAKGIVNAATVGVTTASATAIAADEVIELAHSVDPSYRDNASWQFHDNVALAVRKLKGSGSGDYLWQAGLQAGIPDRLYGYPHLPNQHMASSIASSAKTMLFGQLDKYKLRTDRQVRLRRLEELYAATDQIAFVAFLGADGGLLDAGTHPVKVMQQHS